MIMHDEATLAVAAYDEGKKYLKTLSGTLDKKSKFTNDLLYGMSVMCFEKLFVAYTAHLGFMAEHHMPMALYNEAKSLDKDFPVEYRETAKLMSQFESICSMDGFGYKTPTEEQLTEMIKGLVEIDSYIGPRIAAE